MKTESSAWRETASRLKFISRRRGLPGSEELREVLDRGIGALGTENTGIRPLNRRGLPGGLVYLKPGGYFLLLPDLHGRTDFFYNALMYTGYSGNPVIEDMDAGRAQVVCVGDAFHSEARGRSRWKKAFDEYTRGFKSRRNMDKEMAENLGLLEMIALVKSAWPRGFHFLKGNHENIANEGIEGNFPFRKYAHEGEMVKLWVQNFLGMELFEAIYRWEKGLALMAVGEDFLITHAEPAFTLTPDEVVNCYEDGDIIAGLTWTDNGRAEQGSVEGTLAAFGIDSPGGRIFGGHRPVQGLYDLRQEGRYVQINTPNDWTVGVFENMAGFRPEENIICLNQR